MDNILFSAALAFLVTFFSIPVVINIAKVKKLFDEPDERKVHKSVIPTLGGIGIFSGFIMAFLMGSPAGANPQFQYLVAGAFIIFFLGLKDDIMTFWRNLFSQSSRVFRNLRNSLFSRIFSLSFYYYSYH